MKIEQVLPIAPGYIAIYDIPKEEQQPSRTHGIPRKKEFIPIDFIGLVHETWKALVLDQEGDLIPASKRKGFRGVILKPLGIKNG